MPSKAKRLGEQVMLRVSVSPCLCVSQRLGSDRTARGAINALRGISQTKAGRRRGNRRPRTRSEPWRDDTPRVCDRRHPLDPRDRRPDPTLYKAASIRTTPRALEGDRDACRVRRDRSATPQPRSNRRRSKGGESARRPRAGRRGASRSPRAGGPWSRRSRHRSRRIPEGPAHADQLRPHGSRMIA